jgi:drug/metabolite transporter (DMT)-like permease
VALETFFLFGDALSPVQIAGFAVAITGVWLARR